MAEAGGRQKECGAQERKERKRLCCMESYKPPPRPAAAPIHAAGSIRNCEYFCTMALQCSDWMGCPLSVRRVDATLQSTKYDSSHLVRRCSNALMNWLCVCFCGRLFFFSSYLSNNHSAWLLSEFGRCQPKYVFFVVWICLPGRKGQVSY